MNQELFCYCGAKLIRPLSQFIHCPKFHSFLELNSFSNDIERISIYVNINNKELNYLHMKLANITRIQNDSELILELKENYITIDNFNKSDKIVRSLLNIEAFL